ncbi:hypothetical protein [Alkalisalibacterium limincola]|jgi:hypothetical protein|uniref:Uncharacterized protein n=1 Tax=Alkalisalibacterium limincola TaxID=2699169 RepID=A0A5C8KYF4_9GAMM|nr:hypothetical protein [Alkalisalibacterium limincola]TXK65847.1 hypothetical protein FU658_01760 [Alkalisalibacterium limincola]
MNTDAFWIAFPLTLLSVLALVGASRGFGRVVTAIYPLGHWFLTWPPTRIGLAIFGAGGLVLVAAIIFPFARGLGVFVALLGLLGWVGAAVHDLMHWRRHAKADPYAAAAAARKRKAFGKPKGRDPRAARKKRRHH